MFRGQMLFKYLIKIRVNIGEMQIHTYYSNHVFINIKDPFIVAKLMLTTK